MKNIWFTSDWHIQHQMMLKYRPFSTLEEHNTAIIDACNAVVKRGDMLIHCGDMFWRASRVGYYRQRLLVKELHVVRGNHDAASLRKHVSSLDYMLFRKFGEYHFHFAHYPLESWSAKEHGCIHIHGHSHGRSRQIEGRFDVGIDVAATVLGAYRPFSLDEIIGLYKTNFQRGNNENN